MVNSPHLLHAACLLEFMARRSSKYLLSLARIFEAPCSPPQADYGECARWSIFNNLFWPDSEIQPTCTKKTVNSPELHSTGLSPLTPLKKKSKGKRETSAQMELLYIAIDLYQQITFSAYQSTFILKPSPLRAWQKRYGLPIMEWG
jgi:hypothetical protein